MMRCGSGPATRTLRGKTGAMQGSPERVEQISGRYQGQQARPCNKRPKAKPQTTNLQRGDPPGNVTPDPLP
jgi:hypothetical protein